ncbi:oxidoreductase [Trametes sanguinea]|nr:oxidoreductase [Trametes sanguinea]
MQYVRLGNSGLKAFRIILGIMSYGSSSWQRSVLGEEEAIKHLKFAYDHDITTFDTANAIKQLNLPREELAIMTKLFFPVIADMSVVTVHKKPEELGVINQRGLYRKHIFDSVKASLKRLQLDDVVVLRCHRFDYETPLEETMQALHDVVNAELVRCVGMRACYAYQSDYLKRTDYAIEHDLTSFISMQNHDSLAYREEEGEMFPTLKQFGVGSIPWSHLARGLLTPPLDVQSTRGSWSRRVEKLAKRKNATMAQVALAWILSKPGVSALIIGTTSIKNLEDLLGAFNAKLSEDEIKYSYTPMPIVEHPKSTCNVVVMEVHGSTLGARSTTCRPGLASRE